MWPLGLSISSGSRFFFFPSLSMHSLFYIGIELISETVFISDVQELDSVILRCLSLLSLGFCSI